MKLLNKYKAIGLMSGTSVDGLDLICCEFIYKKGKWGFKIIHGKTKKYSALWRERLFNAHLLSSVELIALDYEFGKFMGRACCSFMHDARVGTVDLIASHGHTVFHQPSKGFTYQLGNGHAIHALTNTPVVNDFRSLDVAHGGEGAPLVPVGDELLFSDYSVCLNVGGIANISLAQGKNRKAFDVCFANMGLDYLARKVGKAYDKGGQLATQGVVDVALLERINQVYGKRRSRHLSLGREGFEQNIRPILDDVALPIADILCTFCEHIAIQINRCVPTNKKPLKVLITGGGALNNFLIHRLQAKIAHSAQIVIPHHTIVTFKEAIVFALLGILRVRGEINVYRDVTGSKQDSSTGCLIGGGATLFS